MIKRNKIYTKNLTPRQRVYGERLLRINNKEHREWNPTRSKLAAAILNGMQNMPIIRKSKILYLGASAGTTPSHVSDIVDKQGIVYAVEFAERMVRELIPVCEKRRNMVPILADARKPEQYQWVEQVDLVYVDVAQPDETELSIRNCKTFLKDNGYLMLCIKSQSIDVTKKPELVYEQEKKKLVDAGFDIKEMIEFSPYEKDHCFILAQFHQ